MSDSQQQTKGCNEEGMAPNSKIEDGEQSEGSDTSWLPTAKECFEGNETSNGSSSDEEETSELLRRAEECFMRHWELLEKSPYKGRHRKGGKDIAMAAVYMNGLDLEYTPRTLRNDKEVVMVACSQDGGALQWASQQLKNDKDVVLVACSRDGSSLQYSSEELRNNKEVVLMACSKYGALPIVYESDNNNQDELDLRAFSEKELSESGMALRFASEEIRNDKEIVLEVCSQVGCALQHASTGLQNDKEVVLEACCNDGHALKFGSEGLHHNKEVVLAACTQDGSALQYASPELQNDKEVVLIACSQDGLALQFASRGLRSDQRTVLTACSQNGNALQFASDTLRAKREVAMAAAESQPESLKFALGGLNQDKDCLIKAKLWDENYAARKRQKIERDTGSSPETKIVLSTRFSLAAESSPHATKFTVELKRHPYIAGGDFVVYSPNAFNKGTCDPNWTDINWPCRGTVASCKNPSHLKNGVPKTDCCWRYSFRHHLREACHTGGFMIQVVDHNESMEYALGDGQQIEVEMAMDVGIQVFRFFEPLPWQRYTYSVYRFVSEIQRWYEEGCKETPTADAPNKQTITIGNSATKIASDDSWEWQMFVDLKGLDAREVSVELHPTFAERVHSLEKDALGMYRSTTFTGWGTFEVVVRVWMNCMDTMLEYTHELQFCDGGAANEHQVIVPRDVTE